MRGSWAGIVGYFRTHIGARILAGFGLIAVLALLVGLVSLANVMTVNTRLETLAQRDREIVTQVLGLQLAVEQQWAAVRSYALSEDERDLAPFEAARDRFDSALAVLERTLDHPDAAAHLARMRDLDAAFASAARRQIILVQQGWRTTSRVATLPTGQSERDALLAEIDAFDRWQSIIVGEELAAARTTAVLAMSVALGLVGLAGVISILIATVLTRSITRPIRSLAGIAAAMKSGDLVVQVPTMGADEIGTLGQTMAQMASALKASRVSLEASLAETEVRNRELITLNTVAAATSSLIRTDLLAKVLDTVLGLTGDEMAGIHLRQADGTMVGGAQRGLPEGLTQPAALALIIRDLDAVMLRPRLPWLALTPHDTEPAGLLTLLRDHGITSTLTVPLTSQGEVVGLLSIGSTRGREFEPGEITLMCNIGSQLGIAIENSSLVHQLEEQVTTLSIINEISHAISAVLNVEDLYTVIYEQCRRVFGIATFTVADWHDERQELVPALVVVDGRREDINPRWPAQPALSLVVARTQQSLVTNDYYAMVQEYGFDYVVAPDPPIRRSWLGVPMTIGDRLLGVIVIATPNRLFSQADHDLMAAIANHAAVAVENARLYQQTRELGVIEERNRLAREIHDTIAQGLTGIVLQLEATSTLLDTRPERARQRLTKVTELARSTLSEARRSVWNLRPQPLEEQSLFEAIETEASRLSDDGLMVQCELVGEPEKPAPETENAVYRIAQEALQNIRKHARATEVDVVLAFDENRLILTIADNGRGFDDATLARQRTDGGGFGLLGMRERARLINGQLEVQSTPGTGTSLLITAPLVAYTRIPPPTQPASPTATRAQIP
ncbi:MAG: GAF domain-containing protein [Chloroflexi bacterium]|nr:GAF domain-containing protein [Chloroflexota bacterium]